MVVLCASRDIGLRIKQIKKFGLTRTAANKMFLQWCRDELVLSFIFVQRLVSWDRTRLRKGTTAETQTLAVIGLGQFGHLTGDTLPTNISHVDKLTALRKLGLKQKLNADKLKNNTTLCIFKKICTSTWPFPTIQTDRTVCLNCFFSTFAM